MRVFGGRLIPLAAAAAIGVLSLLSIASSLALLSSSASPAMATFQAGTISLQSGTSMTPCYLDVQHPSCHYTVTCSGSISAWLGVKITGDVSDVTITDSQGQRFSELPQYQLVDTGYPGDQPVTGGFTTTFLVQLANDANENGVVQLWPLEVESDSNPLRNGEPSW